MIKVTKFGGSSLASAQQMEKVGNIIRSDPDRKYIIPSAPGKRFSDDTKVTDMLYKCYDAASDGEDIDGRMAEIAARYQEIIDGLHIDLSLDDEFALIKDLFKRRAGRDYAASRGEYLNAKIIAAYLDFDFVDAQSIIKFSDKGKFLEDTTNELILGSLDALYDLCLTDMLCAACHH